MTPRSIHHPWAGSRVLTESHCRRDYPGVSHTDPRMYPGRFVPVWAIELRDAFIQAGYEELGKRLNRIIKKRIRDDGYKRERFAQALCGLAELSGSGDTLMTSRIGPDPDLPRRAIEMLEYEFAPHKLSFEERTDLDVAMLTPAKARPRRSRRA